MVLANNNMDMFSVSVFENYIYWSDRCDVPFLSVLLEPLSVFALNVYYSHTDFSLMLFVCFDQDPRKRLYKERE